MMALRDVWKKYPPLEVVVPLWMGYKAPPVSNKKSQKKNAEEMDELMQLLQGMAPSGSMRVN